MVGENSCAALYTTHEQAEAAVGVLQKAGVDIKKSLSLARATTVRNTPLGFIIRATEWPSGARKVPFGEEYGGCWSARLCSGYRG